MIVKDCGSVLCFEIITKYRIQEGFQKLQKTPLPASSIEY